MWYYACFPGVKSQRRPISTCEARLLMSLGPEPAWSRFDRDSLVDGLEGACASSVPPTFEMTPGW
jgi:hypothetical protein